MALGIPTIATNVGTNPGIISHMKNGLLVKTDKEWVEAIQTLANNPDLRAKIGLEARKKITENYSLDVTENKYLSILNELTSN